jgi:hypothetical protein
LTNSNNDMKLRQYYKLYSNILKKEIIDAKRYNYNKLILTSQNRKKKTT